MIRTLISHETGHVFGGNNDCLNCLSRTETIALCEEVYENHASNPATKSHELNAFGVVWRIQQALVIAVFLGYFARKVFIDVAKPKTD